MTIKAILFDLDGVLVDADKLHFDALNKALTTKDLEPISWQEHLTIYKGIPTFRKLEILTERRGLSKGLYQEINETKQRITTGLLYQSCFPDLEKIEMMKLLKRQYKLYVCSNAIKNTVELMLRYSALNFYVDGYLSNEDVTNPKPNPEIYLKAFELYHLKPEQCVIVEDSDVGNKAALASGAFVCKVNGPEEVNYYRILKSIREAEEINIVIPAAGQGKRFAEAGYQHPKPLIDINGQPMISIVLDNFKDIGKNIVLMQKGHINKYCVSDILKKEYLNIELIPVDGLTDGAACSVLLAKELINNNNELIIANSDQHISFNHLQNFIDTARMCKVDGSIMTFKSTNIKWSYAKVGEEYKVVEVAEKKVISNHATVGIYYYKHGKDFVRYAEQMIRKNIRTNNEFYVCPVFNEFILDGKVISIYEILPEDMNGLGTPEDLEIFLKKYV